jgi:acetyl-CoA carboxylase carboxyltransferase component
MQTKQKTKNKKQKTKNKKQKTKNKKQTKTKQTKTKTRSLPMRHRSKRYPDEGSRNFLGKAKEPTCQSLLASAN